MDVVSPIGSLCDMAGGGAMVSVKPEKSKRGHEGEMSCAPKNQVGVNDLNLSRNDLVLGKGFLAHRGHEELVGQASGHARAQARGFGIDTRGRRRELVDGDPLRLVERVRIAERTNVAVDKVEEKRKATGVGIRRGSRGSAQGLELWPRHRESAACRHVVAELNGGLPDGGRSRRRAGALTAAERISGG